MNREEYMKLLQHRLRRLPKEDYNRAIAYFIEYFEEAGPEREAQAIEDLGSPELAADQIIRDLQWRMPTALRKMSKKDSLPCGSAFWRFLPHRWLCRWHWRSAR